MAKELHTKERLWNVQIEVPSQRTHTGHIQVPAIISWMLIHIRCCQRSLEFTLFRFDTEALHPGMVISRTPRLASSCGSKMTRGLAHNASLPEDWGLYYYSHITCNPMKGKAMLTFIHGLNVVSNIGHHTRFQRLQYGGQSRMKITWSCRDLVLGHSLSEKQPS
jgi:hypothetical protein